MARAIAAYCAGVILPRANHLLLSRLQSTALFVTTNKQTLFTTHTGHENILRPL